MPKFSEASIEKLKTCHVDLMTIFVAVIQKFDCSIIYGYRGKEDQDKAFKTGKSKLQFPDSKHNSMPSMAVDAAPFPIDWSNTTRFFWFAGYVMGVADQLYLEGKISHKVRYGGDWNVNYNIDDEKGLRDLVHFELVKL